jgi:DnaK suppressor protein
MSFSQMTGNAMARKDAIEKLRKTLLKRREALVRAATGDLSLLQGKSSKTGDILDAVAESVQSELNSQLLEVESRELQAIDDALERLDRGDYGDCQSCGKPIPLTRLRAVPQAKECIGCHRLAEKRKSHPAASMNRVFHSYHADSA